MNTIGAIKIITNIYGEHYPEIGLYSNGDDPCEIRFSESELFGVSDDYNYDLLINDGIGEIEESFSDSQGGNSVSINDFKVQLSGTEQLVLRWQELGINIEGLSIQYIEFVGTDDDSDYESIDVMFTGTIETVTYNQFIVEINSKSSFTFKRNKLIAKEMTTSDYPDIPEELIGETAPVTFGSSSPDDEVWFKLIRTEYVNKILNSSEITYPLPVAVSISKMPVIFNDGYSDEESNILIRVLYAKYIKLETLPDLGGYYLAVVSGSNGSDGEVRLIASSDDTEGGDTVPTWHTVMITVKDVFSRRLPAYGISGGTTYKTFVNILSVLFRYSLDYYHSYETMPDSFYVKGNDKCHKIDSVDIIQNDVTMPSYDLKPSVLTSGGDSIEALSIVPVTDFWLLSTETQDLVEFGYESSFYQWSDGSEVVPGLYVYSGVEYEYVTDLTETGKSNAFDKDLDTYYQASFNINNTYPADAFSYIFAFEIELPEIPDNAEFDSVHLGIAANLTTVLNPFYGPLDSLHVKVCRRERFNQGENFDEQLLSNGNGIYTLPDNYFITDIDNHNIFRYQEKTITGTEAWAPYSLNNFNLNIDSINTYRNSSVVVMFRVLNSGTDVSDIDNYLRIMSLAICFKKSLTIPEEIYA